MAGLILGILPLALASSFSPLILGASISLLARKNSKAAAAFFLGGLLSVCCIAFAGATVAGEDDRAALLLGFRPQAADLFFGAIFLAFGLKVFFEKPKAETLSQGKGRGAAKWLALGFFGNILNFDAVLLNFAAVRQIFNAALPLGYQLALVAFCSLFYLAPSLGPLLLYCIAPSKSERALEPAGRWMSKYGHFVIGAIFIAFGVYLIGSWA